MVVAIAGMMPMVVVVVVVVVDLVADNAVESIGAAPLIGVVVTTAAVRKPTIGGIVLAAVAVVVAIVVVAGYGDTIVVQGVRMRGCGWAPLREVGQACTSLGPILGGHRRVPDSLEMGPHAG